MFRGRTIKWLLGSNKACLNPKLESFGSFSGYSNLFSFFLIIISPWRERNLADCLCIFFCWGFTSACNISNFEKNTNHTLHSHETVWDTMTRIKSSHHLQTLVAFPGINKQQWNLQISHFWLDTWYSFWAQFSSHWPLWELDLDLCKLHSEECICFSNTKGPLHHHYRQTHYH